MRRRYVYADTCANTEQCHYWPRHDARCHRNTEPHSAMCSVHADRDYLDWRLSHDTDECCDTCCEGVETHE